MPLIRAYLHEAGCEVHALVTLGQRPDCSPDRHLRCARLASRPSSRLSPAATGYAVAGCPASRAASWRSSWKTLPHNGCLESHCHARRGQRQRGPAQPADTIADSQASPSTGKGKTPGTAEPHHRTGNPHHTRPRTAGEDDRPTCPATIGRARGAHAHQPPCDTVTSPRVPVSVRRTGRPAGGSRSRRP